MFWFNKLFTQANGCDLSFADYRLKKLINIALLYKMRSFKCMAGHTAKHSYWRLFRLSTCVMHNAISSTTTTTCYWFSNLKIPRLTVTFRSTLKTVAGESAVVSPFSNWHPLLVSLLSSQRFSICHMIRVLYTEENSQVPPLIFQPPPFLWHLTSSAGTQGKIKAHPFLLAAQINLKHSAWN